MLHPENCDRAREHKQMDISSTTHWVSLATRIVSLVGFVAFIKGVEIAKHSYEFQNHTSVYSVSFV